MDQTPVELLEVIERAAVELVDPAGGGRWWRLPESELATALRTLERVKRLVTVAQADTVADAAARGVPSAEGERTTAGWVAQALPVTPGEAREVAELAAVTSEPGLRPLDAALRTGSVGPDSALVVSRGLGRLPACVDADTKVEAAELLAGYAASFHRTALKRLVDQVVLRLDPDGGDKLARDEAADHRLRSLAVVEDANGTWQVKGRLPQTAGQAVAAVIGALAKPLPAADGTPDARTAGQRNADALEQMAHRVMALESGEPGALPLRGGVPPRVVLTVDLATVQARLGTPGLSCASSDTGVPVSPSQLSLLLCDAEVVGHLLTADGQRLDVGDRQYVFPPRIRAAIAARDRHCRYGTCQAPASWCHVHHLVPFSRGGPTSERNGALLCGRHHRLVHRRGLVGRLTGDEVTWHRADEDDHSSRRTHAEDPVLPGPPSRAAVAAAVASLVDRQRQRLELSGLRELAAG